MAEMASRIRRTRRTKPGAGAANSISASRSSETAGAPGAGRADEEGYRPPVLLRYRTSDKEWAQVEPDAAGSVAFEQCLPARPIRVFEGQRNTPGFYWCASDAQLHAYESNLERIWMTLLDFDDADVALAAQPFLIDVASGDTVWQHTPDIFARTRSGRGRVINVKAPNRFEDPRVLLQSRRTAALCRDIGIDYELVGEPDPHVWRNVDLLAGYRRPIVLPAAVTCDVYAAAEDWVSIDGLCASQAHPDLERTAVLQALWNHELSADLLRPLCGATMVRRASDPAVATENLDQTAGRP